MRQGVGVYVRLINQDGCGAAFYFAHGDEQHKYRGLEDIQSNNFFDQVGVGDDDIETHHHQYDDNPVIKMPCNHRLLAELVERIKNCNHDRGHRNPHAQFNQENTQMLGVLMVVQQYVVVEELSAQ